MSTDPDIGPPGHNEHLVRLLLRPADWLVEKYFRAELDGLHRLPEGPALLVANHSGGVTVPDAIVLFDGYAHHTQCRDIPVALGHQLIFRIPIIRAFVRNLGVRSASKENALRALAEGKKVLVFPGGDWEAMRPSRDRDKVDFGQRKGFLQLALRAEVPIVPVVTAGAHDGWYVITRGHRIARALRIDRLLRIKVFPIALALPTGIVIGPVPVHIPLPRKVVMEVLPPIHLGGDPEDDSYLQRAYDEVVTEMQTTLDRLVERLPRHQKRTYLRPFGS